MEDFTDVSILLQRQWRREKNKHYARLNQIYSTPSARINNSKPTFAFLPNEHRQLTSFESSKINKENDKIAHAIQEAMPTVSVHRRTQSAARESSSQPTTKRRKQSARNSLNQRSLNQEYMRAQKRRIDSENWNMWSRLHSQKARINFTRLEADYIKTREYRRLRKRQRYSVNDRNLAMPKKGKSGSDSRKLPQLIDGVFSISHEALGRKQRATTKSADASSSGNVPP